MAETELQWARHLAEVSGENEMLVGAMRAILEAGLSIPKDIALIGVANMHSSDMFRVPLSTVDQGTAAMGEQAANLLLASMAAKKPLAPRQLILPPRRVMTSD